MRRADGKPQAKSGENLRQFSGSPGVPVPPHVPMCPHRQSFWTQFLPVRAVRALAALAEVQCAGPAWPAKGPPGCIGNGRGRSPLRPRRGAHARPCRSTALPITRIPGRPPRAKRDGMALEPGAGFGKVVCPSCGCSSMAERQPSKLAVAGSSPVARFSCALCLGVAFLPPTCPCHHQDTRDATRVGPPAIPGLESRGIRQVTRVQVPRRTAGCAREWTTISKPQRANPPAPRGTESRITHERE